MTRGKENYIGILKGYWNISTAIFGSICIIPQSITRTAPNRILFFVKILTGIPIRESLWDCEKISICGFLEKPILSRNVSSIKFNYQPNWYILMKLKTFSRSLSQRNIFETSSVRLVLYFWKSHHIVKSN